MSDPLRFVVPGALDTATGGYAYDRAVITGLRARGLAVDVETLPGDFPRPSPASLTRARSVLAALPAGTLVVVDGLAFGAMPDLAAAESRRLRFIALVHHPLALETGLDAESAARLRDSERVALGHAARVIATSHETARLLACDYGVDAARLRVVEPGVDGTSVAVAREAAAATKRMTRLLCVATLTPRKGHASLLRALAACGSDAWQLRCVGSDARDAGCAQVLRELAQDLGIAARVTFTGELPEAALRAEYAAADAFVLAAHFEGYGMAVAEAVAHGLPVVATATGAISRLVPPDAGHVVPVGDGPALTRALAALLGDAVHRERLQAGARVAAATTRRWEDAAREFAAALADLRGPASSAGRPAA